LPTPVAVFAAAKGLAVDKTADVNGPGFLSAMRALAPDFVVVVAFGQILRRGLLELPRTACVNVHASLLPRHRGASPVAACILAGDATTGVSFMRMDAGLDTGPVYETAEMPLDGNEDAVGLETALGELAAGRIGGVLRRIAGGLTPVPQDNAAATYAGKVGKRDGALEWRRPAWLIERRVRAYAGWPGVSFGMEAGGRVIRVRVSGCAALAAPSGAPGEVLSADKSRWIVACGEGALELSRIVPGGKTEMSGADFLRGRPMSPGDRLPLE
jgi:methionyl-tRNA formyltransferase